MAEPFTIRCTHCRKEYKVTESSVGRRVKCKKCGEVFIVTRPASPDPNAPIDLSGFEVEPSHSNAPLGVGPPPLPHPSAQSRMPAPPPIYSAPPAASGDYSTGHSYRWRFLWLLVVVPVWIGIRLYHSSVAHNGGWDIESAAMMTNDQKRDQTAANLARLGPALASEAPTASPLRTLDPGRIEFLSLPHSMFVSPFNNGKSGSTDYKFLHLEALKNPNFANFIVLYDDCELQANDGTTVYRASGAVEHLSLEDFQQQSGKDELAVEQLHNPFLHLTPPHPFRITTPHPNPIVPSPLPFPAPQPRVADNFDLLNKRAHTANVLYRISSEIRRYHGKDNNEFPPSLDIPLGFFVFKGSQLHSPFGPPGSKGDYSYRHYGPMHQPFPKEVILAYDQAERNADTGTSVLRANGSVDVVRNSDFDAAMQDSDRVATAASAKYQATKDRPDEVPLPDSAVRTIAGHAWSARPDSPAAAPSINTHIRQVIAGRITLIYPSQPSHFVLVRRSDIAHGPNAEIWNLATDHLVSRYSASNDLMDPILSPDGEHVVGRVMGGVGEATTFQAISTSDGKVAQTLTAPPGKCPWGPIPIGFTDAGQAITVADGIQVWDLKQGTLVRQIALGNARELSDLYAVSATGKLVARVSPRQNSITLFSIESGKMLGSSALPDFNDRQGEWQNESTVAAFSPDGREVAMLLGGKHIYVWSVADGKLAGNFTLAQTVENALKQTVPGRNSLAWMPDSQGWLIAGERVVDRATGVVIYNMPNFHETMADEIETRQVVDSGHLLLAFQSTASNKSALEVMPFDGAVIQKARAGVRTPAPDTQPK